MASLSDLLADPDATKDLVAAIVHLSPDLFEGNAVEYIEWVSQKGWVDRADGPAGGFIPPLLETDLEIAQHLDPLEISGSFGAYSQIGLINDLSADYQGRYDSWHRHSIDNRPVTLYLVGVLSTGERVELGDVLETPLFALRGVGIPEPGDTRCVLNVRDGSQSLEQALQPETYSPPCLRFPGTNEGGVDFGDHFDQTGSFSAAGWAWLEDPTVGAQYAFYKLADDALSGWALFLGGTVGVTVGAQTPATTQSGTGILHAKQWHHISISVNVGTGTRTVGVDGVTVGTSTGVTGSPSASPGVSFRWGPRCRGKLADWTIWSTAKTVAQMWSEARKPVLPTAVNLAGYFPADEQEGDLIHDRTTGSSLTGNIGAGVEWDVASWHLSAIAGAYRPFVLGTVNRVPVTWIDPANQIGEVSFGGCHLISEVQSNHNTLGAVGGLWSYDRDAGTVQVISGAISGTYSATVTANNLWGTALQATAASKYLATIDSFSNPCTLTVQFAPSASQAGAAYFLIGWHGAAAAPGAIYLGYSATGGANRLEALCVNDAGTAFVCTSNTYLEEGRTYSLALVRNHADSTLSIHVDGEPVASVAISGTFATTIGTFGVGIRGDGTLGTQALGRLDEPLLFDRALTQAEIRALHVLPATGEEANLQYGWHLDDGTGTAAAWLVGEVDLTLTAPSWVAGRSCAADLARVCYYRAGYSAADLDTDSWRECVNLNPADCGWFVGNGETALATVQLILGGLGFIGYELYGKVYIRRFDGLTGVPAQSFSVRTSVRAGDVEADGHEPAVWEWSVLYAHNNVRQDAASIAGALASSDPERYLYGQVDDLTAKAADFSIRKINSGQVDGRFPGAIAKTRQTALLFRRDAEAEARRLLDLHRHGADTKSVPLWLLPDISLFDEEVAFDITECEMDQSTWIVTGYEVRGDETQATVWRPATTGYTTSVITDDGSAVITDEGDVVVID
jgi:hypothetical protein